MYMRLSSSVWLRVIIYPREWREPLTPESCLVYTIVLVDYGEKISKK